LLPIENGDSHNGHLSPYEANQSLVLRQTLTNMSISGTSISTPTTVASDAPEESPNSMVEVAMATSKWFDAPSRRQELHPRNEA